MKKSLLALAVLATAAGAASAQSSVTLFGIVDAGVARLYGKNTNLTGMTNSGLNSSRLGFRGTEDLGGGMAASFWLEGQLNNDDGTGNGTGGAFVFQRRSTVSLSGGFGELRLGRDYAANFWNLTVFDPFGTNGVGQGSTSLGRGAPVRTSNTVGYFLPGNLGGFYGQLQYAFGEQPGSALNSKNGNYVGLRVGYGAGPVNVAYSHSRLYVQSATTGVSSNVTSDNIGASWDFGVVKAMGYWAQEKGGTVVGAGNKTKAWLIGATAPVGVGEIRVAYSKVDPDGSASANKFALGYGHNLSKRTQVYGTWARAKSKGATYSYAGSYYPVANNGLGALGNIPGKSGGFEVGIRHAF